MTIHEYMYLEQLLKGIDGYQYHFIRSTVDDGKIILEYCPIDQMLADVMTKPVTKFNSNKLT